MLKEILEEQGFEFLCNFGRINVMHTLLTQNGVLVQENNFISFEYKENIEEAFEQASRQYVKENGFALGWFEEDSMMLMQLCIYYETMIEKLTKSKGFGHKETKLMAWLYANDIKVVS